MLTALFREGGPIMPVLIVVALIGYVMAWERVLVWAWWILHERPYFPVSTPKALHARVARLAHGGRLSPLERVLAAAERLRGRPAAEREARLQVEIGTQLQRVDARISTLGWLGGILPMLGLLGTVSGMITTFDDLALTTSRQVLSRGLSEALWTTEVGQLGALPLLAVHHFLSRMRERWLTRLERCLALLEVERPEHQAGPAGEASDEA
jgi:biopolymer transport protein ExbB/TolQ